MANYYVTHTCYCDDDERAASARRSASHGRGYKDINFEIRTERSCRSASTLSYGQSHSRPMCDSDSSESDTDIVLRTTKRSYGRNVSCQCCEDGCSAACESDDEYVSRARQEEWASDSSVECNCCDDITVNIISPEPQRRIIENSGHARDPDTAFQNWAKCKDALRRKNYAKLSAPDRSSEKELAEQQRSKAVERYNTWLAKKDEEDERKAARRKQKAALEAQLEKEKKERMRKEHGFKAWVKRQQQKEKEEKARKAMEAEERKRRQAAKAKQNKAAFKSWKEELRKRDTSGGYVNPIPWRPTASNPRKDGDDSIGDGLKKGKGKKSGPSVSMISPPVLWRDRELMKRLASDKKHV